MGRGKGLGKHGSPEHGTHNMYQHYGCRCVDCKAASAARSRRLRANWLKVNRASTAPHGVRTTYVNYGCRCAPCKKANSLACKDYYRRKKEEKND